MANFYTSNTPILLARQNKYVISSHFFWLIYKDWQFSKKLSVSKEL